MSDDFVLETCDECEWYPCQCDGPSDDEGYCITCNNLRPTPSLANVAGDLCICLNNGEMPCPDCEP